MSGGAVVLTPLAGMPEVTQGDDLAALLDAALGKARIGLRDGDVLVVSSKVVSKAAGLKAPAAERVARALTESTRVVAERRTAAGLTRVVEAVAGPVLAGAGIDASNTGDPSSVLLLPRDPDAVAARLRAALLARRARADRPVTALGIVLSDTAGRPWRAGQTDFALGCAGLVALEDLRGTADADGRELTVTARAVADEIAAAADLVKGKANGVAAAHVRGPGLGVVVPALGTEHPGAAALVRTGPADWFAFGHVEAVRAALGVAPGTPEALQVGVPATPVEDVETRLRRACVLATDPGGWGEVAPGHPRETVLEPELRLDEVSVDVVQAGVRVHAPEEFTLGVAVARLLVALASEGLAGRLARRDPRAPASALVVLV